MGPTRTISIRRTSRSPTAPRPLLLLRPGARGQRDRGRPPEAARDLGFRWARPEDRRPDPHHRRALRDGGLVVAAHAHRELGQVEAEPVAQPAQRGEVWARIALGRRNAHEPPQRDPGQLRHGLRERRALRRGAPRLRRLAPDVHLEQHARRRAPRGRSSRDLLREREPVDGVHPPHLARQVLHLVRLEGADEVPHELAQIRERRRLVAPFLRVVLPEVALPSRVRLADGLRRLRLGDGDERDARRDARAHGGEALPDRAHGRALHGSAKPRRSSSASASARGSPTTFETLPRSSSTNAPPAPWTAYAPALSRGSPVATYHAICASVRRAKRTAVVAASTSSRPSRRAHTAVTTWCGRPESARSMRRASSPSAGFPRMAPSSTTAVSAPSTVSPATARAFSRATRRT